MAVLIDGIKISNSIKNDTQSKVEIIKKNKVIPTLAVVAAGDAPSAKGYINNNRKACEYTGIRMLSFELPSEISQQHLLGIIDELNSRNDVHGILVQLPLPGHIHENIILSRISQEKDVDCFHPCNIGMLNIGQPNFKPCTPAGIIALVHSIGMDLSGKHSVIVSNSNLIGRTAGMLLLSEGATVTVCHFAVENIDEICSQGDILIAAVGIPNYVKPSMVKEGSVVIDTGLHRLCDNKLCGDVDFVQCAQKAGWITPVTGGLGPVSIAMLMKNCALAAERV